MDNEYQAVDNLNTLYFTQFCVLTLGLLIGISAAYQVTFLKFNFFSDLQTAKKLGILSLTILNNYSKSNDVLRYIIELGLPVITASCTWLIWIRKLQPNRILILCPTETEMLVGKDVIWRYYLAFIVIIYLLCSYNINYFYRIDNGWSFLGEEGENLAWVQAILHGKVYGKDFFCLYGPLLIYPLAWAMKLFGATIAVARGYTLFLNLIAYGIVISFLYSTCRSKLTFVMAALLYLLIFSPLFFLSPNCSYFRVAIGILPLLFIHHYYQHAKKLLLITSGIVIGLSLMLSQEVGICAVIAVFLNLLIRAVSENDYKKLKGELFLIGCSVLLTISPLLIYMTEKGALASFWDMIYGYPKMVTLGYEALPFPSISNFFKSPLYGGALLHHSIIAIYMVIAAFIFPRLLMRLISPDNRLISPDTLLTIGILIFGILLFRSALGRSDEYHVYYASQPAFLLLFLSIDRAVESNKRYLPIIVKAGNLFKTILLSLFIVFLFNYSYMLKMNLLYLNYDLTHFSQKLIRNKTGVELSNLTRSGNVSFDPITAATLNKIGSFLNKNTVSGDYVYFFPNEAAYYFLFNRTNPTRFPISYFAGTSKQRQEIVADMENKKPFYVIYTLNSWRIDNIPEEIQVPEVVKYLQENYRVSQNMGTFLVLQRKP